MDEYTFDDALTGSTVTCGFPGLETMEVRSADAPRRAASLFFPGCSLLNYGLPLVRAVYATLIEGGQVDGLSLLCCGKILSFEAEGARVRAAFEKQLRESVIAADVERIVAACPNCVVALRAALAADVATAGVEVIALPVLLNQRGYRIDASVAADMVAEAAGCAADNVRVCIHDSCPDRATGEFADGLRALMPDELVVEAAHIRKRSFCCGSLLRAAGKPFVADAQAQRHGEEARSVDAAALVTACVSCAFQLSTSQVAVPVFHYLELLYAWRIPWEYSDAYMKLRFLFDNAGGCNDGEVGNRAFVGLACTEEVDRIDVPTSVACADDAEGESAEARVKGGCGYGERA